MLLVKNTNKGGKLNDRRKSVGLNSIDEYLKEMNEVYKGKLQ